MTSGENMLSQIETSLIEAVAAVLGMEKHRVDPKENLSAYGFDSITLTQLANRLTQTFPFVRPDASTFLEYTTVEALQAHLHDRYRVDFEVYFGIARAETRTPPASQAGISSIADSYPPAEPVHSEATFAIPDISGSLLLDAFDADEQRGLHQPVPNAFASAPVAVNKTQTVPVRAMDIAIVGVAGRFPGADNIIELWENLFNEKNSLTEVPEDRWDWRAIFGDPQADGNLTDCCYGGFLDKPGNFDPLFFGISPLEALQMDPQQKLVLQSTWETLENAGYSMDRLNGEDVGVYLGVQRNENLLQLMKGGKDFGPYTNIGNTHSMLANRVSYFFDWKGNSLTVDTACAASSSALHLACHALLRGEIKFALVGGVTVVQDSFSHIANRKMGLLTNEQRVCSFDENAGGYLIGEGVATALLKPLAQAEKDGDYIYGVIKGCAVTQSGKTVFLTAPDPKSHVKVIQAALQEAGLKPEAIDYIEGQGIGTELSDKAELKAYAEVFRNSENHKLGIGSTKGNIGHVESASGITSLIKVCLAMKNGRIPPVLNFQKLNWSQSEDELPFTVVAQKQAWEPRADRSPRRAGVHNFGYGGLTAHFIIEQHTNACERQVLDHNSVAQEQLLVFSSKSRPQLDRYLARFLTYIQGSQYRYFGIQRLNLADVAYTLQTGRQEMDVRLAVVAASVEELAAKLQRYLNGDRQIARLLTGTVAARAAQEKIPPALYQARAWDRIAGHWVNGSSWSSVAGKGQRIPLPGFCFAPEPDFEAAADGIKPQLNPVDWHRFSGAFEELEDIARQLLLDRFQSWGICRTPGEELESERLQALLGIAPQYRRLFSLLPGILAKAGILQQSAGRYRVIEFAPVDMADLQRRRDDFLRNFPELKAQIGLTWDCLDCLQDILTGKIPVTRILFPDSSMERVESFYKGNPVVDYFNKLVSWQLVAAVSELDRQRPAGEKIRILEIGAGTGGTTEGVLKSIAHFGERLSYVYSDISPGFTQFGKSRFGAEFGFLEFQVLNIEKDIVEQGFAEHSFDLIIACNVLHATADMDRTIQNTRHLLKSDGSIILNEVTHAQDFISLTFGLLHGWWAFADEDRRLPGGPLLNSTMWAGLLKRQGFASVEIYGQSGPEGEDSGYNVVVASNKTEALAAKPAAIADVAPMLLPDHGLILQVREIFAKVLMIDEGQIDPNAAYVNFGVDSFTSLTVVKEINAAFGVQLRSTELFNFPSINEISLHIQQQIEPVAPTPQQPLPRSVEKRQPATDPSVDNQEGIAIIGMSGRFPHAKNIDEYWRNLVEGRDCIDDVPPGRWQGKGFWGGFVDDIDRFDPLFFNISPKEAEWMDPQQRLFVQEAWRTFEHAGYAAEDLKGSRCGVYVGCRESDYLKPFAQLGTSSYQGTGNSAAMLSARIAYFLDLKGPSLSIDTACSSSLVAIHLACESINSGTCDLALAGGVSLFCTEQSHLILGKSGMLSPDGRCKTFDDRADGFVPAEAVGAVLLKPLQHALRDGDPIFGVIKAHGINQDGKTNGITASSSPSQSALQQEVYRRYRINPERISYVEAHGTGTGLGDPIEIDALTDTFRAYTQRKQFCAIGSAKTAIGHGLAAAGVAGLIKVLLSMRHKQLPPMLHFQKENRHFQLANTPFYVNTKAQDWDNANKEPLQAAISAFGFSGTNAHCVIEEAPHRPEPAEGKKSYLIPLSAKTAIDLAAKIQALAGWLENEGDAYALRDIATTLLLGRSHFDFRVALVANDKQALAALLKGLPSRPDSGWTKIKPEQERGAALKQFGARLLTEIRDLELPENERDESLLSLADLYRQGYELEWRLLYQHNAAAKGVFRKVPLPTYPFVGERYWLAPMDGIAVNAQAPTAFVPVALPSETPELKAFQHAYAEVPGFCAMLLADTLHNMGVFEMPGQRYLREELRGQLQIDAKYHRLLDAFLNILLDEGYLQRQGDYFVRTGREWRLPFAELQQRKDCLLSEFSQIGAFVNLIWVCVRNYPEVLQGKLNATEVIFPDASFELVKGIYKDNATADFYNKILVNNVLEQVRIQTARLPGKQLKILEIGAGTGGTSALLLNALQRFGDSISYLYTDISSGFIQYGRRTYGPRYPFADFEVLDIEKAIVPDCVYRKSFDIVVAANVIHATRDLCKTLAHVKALLKDKGYLFLNETTDIQAFATMTYGLLDGWWLFEDDIRLENSPLLDDKMWVALLQQQGFSVAPPQGLSGAEKGPGQHILIAELLEDKAALHDAAPVSEPVPAAVQPAAATKISRPVQETLKQRIQQEVTDAIFHILGLNDRQLVMEKRFADYGLDSISGIDFLSLVNQQFGINVRVTALFDYPSVAELSAFIYENYREQLSAPDFADAPETSANEADDKEDESATSASCDVPEMQQDDIAIIGMSGRFSGSRNVHEFWEQLASGTSCISEPPTGRWAEGGFPPGYRAGFLDGIDQFDPLFFNWSGAEAEQADPQQRLFLEESYAALEDAGYAPAQLRELTCGVFAGVGMSDYLINMRERGYFGEAQSFWGNSPAVVPARISYFLNLKGPSIAIDTACSSSLVAMHSARQSILAGECDMALAGGVYLCTTPHFHTLADKAQMLAADGICKAFDQKADGFVFGEGVGVVVLKRLDAAIRDKDHIYGVLKASGVNQDGKTNGMTAPSTLSQTELEVAVYRRAGINPETIGYVEGHGTGTKLGDPVEVEALSKAFRRYTDKKQFCLLGSVKTNIGHSSLAAGVAGVIKVLQCFAHSQIPPLLNFSEANEHIDFNDSPFHINTRLYEWKKHGDLPRRAAISGFGLSGTNAHLVLEESPVRLESRPVRGEGPVLICLSAKTGYSLKQKIRDLATCLEAQGRQYALEYIAYTLHVGREHFGQRFALVAQSREDLLRQLREADIDAMPRKTSELSGDAELWLKQLRARNLPLPETLEKLHALAALYRDGRDMEWLKLYPEDVRYRVPLPSYPFDRSRFWFPAPTAKALQPQAEAQVVPVPGAAMPVSGSAEKTWWQPDWQPSPLDSSLASHADGPLLIFGSGQQDLSGWQNTKVVLVTSGEDFSVAPQGTVPGADAVIRIRAGEPEDYRQLAGLLAQRGLLPTRILHCWSQQPFVADELDKQLDRGFYSMLFIAQALIEQKACPEKIRVIYAFVRSASRDYALNQAIGSFAKTLNRENPAFYCQTLELPQAALLSQIADREYRHGTANQVEVRYRRDANGELVREVKVWRSVDLENATAKPPALKEQGTYLLIGGAGGLGLLFCEYLRRQAEAQQNRIRVFLTGRRPLSADKLQQLQRLNSTWCEAVYLQADIADAAQAKYVVAEARSRLGGIAGIFHFAGCAQDAFLLKKTKSQCREVLAAKVQGTLCLEQALAGEKVDFLSFFSSASSVTGNVGQADYAYANGFFDAFAAQGGIGGRMFSVNWAFWQQGGMQLSDSKLETMAADMGVHGLSGAVGIQAWESILQSGLTQCMFLSGNGQKIRQFVEKQFAEPQRVKKTGNARFDAQNIYRQAESVGRLNDTVGMAQRSADIDAATGNAMPLSQDIEAFLKQAVADVSRLPLDKISIHRPFDEFGLDSLMITALNEKLIARFGPLSATLFFEYQDLASLTEYLSARKQAAQAEVVFANNAGQVSCRTASGVDDIYRKAEAIGHAAVQGIARSIDALEAIVASSAPVGQDIEAFLKQAVADVSRLPLDKISAERPFEEFGLDSLMITALNEKLIARFGPLSATLFFEHRNLAALTEYLAARQHSVQPAPAKIAELEYSAGRPANKQASSQAKLSDVGNIYSRAKAIGHEFSRSDGCVVAKAAASAASVNVRQDIEAFLRKAVADVSALPIEEIGVYRPFDELGLDSLMITALNEKLIARFGQLSATLFFEYPNLAALSEYLSGWQASAKACVVAEENIVGRTPCPDDAKRTLNIGDIYKKAAQIGIADNAATQASAFRADKRQDTSSVAGNSALDIAIIGVSGIYPEADNLEIFWDNLKAGRDSITEVPPNRWNPDEYYDADRTQAMHGKMYCTKGGFVDDIDCFDAFFFNISPREAKLIDPCERLFLQTAWAAFEDAGYTRKKLAETGNANVGVFAGISNYGYSLWGPQEWAKGNSYTPCSGLWSIANRVSYFMNLNGPSYPVDTACSSSLSAIHQACVSLNNGECSMALAGGASFNVHPHQYVAMCQGQMLSPTGKCHSFGEQGDGFVPGEGVGAVLLKPLAQAVADRDPIYAVIKGSSVNHGGRSNGYSVPNPKAQAELIKQALNKAKIDPATISYVEAHGTGTALGDPVEFEGLCRAWDEAAGQQAVEKQSCALGSVKSNIGHLGAAAGISGLTKILLQMKHKTLAPSLHAQKLNPKINFADSPFFVQQSPASWETKPEGQPRRAAVSSFGAGGANAHVILEDYALPSTACGASPVSGPYIIPISAKTPERLLRYVEKILAFWEKHQGELQLQDFAYTLQTGREAMTERFACIVNHKQEVGMKLRAFLQHNGQAEQGSFFTGQAGDNAAQEELAASPDHEQLAKLWVRGGDIDWEALFYRQQAAKRISLPTYPFDKQPYWYVEKTVVEPAGKAGRANDPLARCTEAFDDLAELGASGLLSAFQQMGCFRQDREEYAKDRLKACIRLSLEHDLLYDALLDILQTAGYLAIDGDRIRSTERVSQKVEAHNLDYWCNKHPELAANFQLLWQCLDNMTAILQGDIPATEVMFPNASMALVEKIYQQNAISDYYNQLVVDEVVSFIRERLSELPEGEKIHLLEIGAGTGGTSAAVLKAIEPYQEYLRYDYTDVSLKFIQHGRKHYGHYTFVDFHVLDIEKGIEGQGFVRQNTDLIIATNVLHATRNMNVTLKNAKSLLRRGGKLIINEAVEPHVFSTLTFGLLKGWWLAEDPHNRLPGSPLLSVSMWRRLLEHEGFMSVRTLAPVIETGVSQNVFVAQSDGRIPLHEEQEPREMAASSIPKPEPVDIPEYDEKLNILAQKLRHIVAAVIEVEAETINPDCAYVDMGVDSILALEIVSQANRELGSELRTTAVFDHATVNKLAAHIAAQHPGAVQQDALLDVFQQLHSGGLDIHEADRLLGL
ncbi:SDR family NAD(P)-dependent oxidoreductase [Candidatus Methylobacter oryzae]|uniref:SDR family NAD(P)-dependent oxidoreductase n=1 Tax=Candidatus Methylobacter oryzae TaxID=2497749 RepID=A0ABY3C5S2_9GAMM|nr:SDR family NAD(P)-dependent oxidoreductase [Candidatus Methylobacter oryzae]TRW90026.1 SDR family NAD(P)-dependent oxidoreductase [Candidatus Methylobacter oryzae]